MIPYELAKELKEAGFPMGSMGETRCKHTVEKYKNLPGSYVCDDAAGRQDGSSCERVYFPTHSELLGAIGDRFRSLFFLEGSWCAKGMSLGPDRTSFERFGETPEVALGRLWLVLNPKQ